MRHGHEVGTYETWDRVGQIDQSSDHAKSASESSGSVNFFPSGAANSIHDEFGTFFSLQLPIKHAPQ